jgi:hypothetical protein
MEGVPKLPNQESEGGLNDPNSIEITNSPSQEETEKLEDTQSAGLLEIREKLGLGDKAEKTPQGWRVTLKPENEWKQETEIVTEEPIDRLKHWIKSFLPSERQKVKISKENFAQFDAERSSLYSKFFIYRKGQGVEGRTGSSEVGIMAEGFGECSGLIFQTPDKVSIVHISPNTIRGTFSGGEIVRDQDIDGHISSALRNLIDEEKEFLLTTSGTKLTPEEVNKLQGMINAGSLKSTLISGEDTYVAPTIVPMIGERAREHNLPNIKIESHYVGNSVGSGYKIWASTDSVYVFGANDVVMKKGVNLPPTMFNFEDR